MSDTVKRKALQQHVFHDGKSMVVLIKDQTVPIPHQMVNRLVEDGIIDGDKIGQAKESTGTGSKKSDKDAGGKSKGDGAPAS